MKRLSLRSVARARGLYLDNGVRALGSTSMRALFKDYAPQDGRWVFLLCQFPDDKSRPPNADTYLRQIFTEEGTGGVCDYWHDVSMGHLNLSYNTVSGWYTLPQTLSYYSQFNWNTNPVRRMKLIIDGINAAVASGNINFLGYTGIAVILNTLKASESGSMGEIDLTLNGVQKTYGTTILDPGGWQSGFAAHEMGHGYGFNHSTGVSKEADSTLTQYGDKSDIMSYASVYRYSDSNFGFAGPGLSAPYAAFRGWLHQSRIHSVSGRTNTEIRILALGFGEYSGILMTKVLCFKNAMGIDYTRYYTLEFRKKARWDRGFVQDVVVIHHVRPGGAPIIWQPAGAASGPGEDFLKSGQTFVDTVNRVTVTFVGVEPDQRSARVRITIAP